MLIISLRRNIPLNLRRGLYFYFFLYLHRRKWRGFESHPN
jgi:hypothetical protein